jgi:hypothetical protein
MASYLEDQRRMSQETEYRAQRETVSLVRQVDGSIRVPRALTRNKAKVPPPCRDRLTKRAGDVF